MDNIYWMTDRRATKDYEVDIWGMGLRAEGVAWSQLSRRYGPGCATTSMTKADVVEHGRAALFSFILLVDNIREVVAWVL